MIRARLTKLSDNPNALRTRMIEGLADEVPMIGRPFVIWNDKPLVVDKDYTNREVWTSAVVRTELGHSGSVVFWTRSGTNYLFEEINDAPSEA